MATTTNDFANETPTICDRDACWELLKRVVASPHLSRAPRLQEVLHYLGERSLKDGCRHLQEHEIGTHVFHRPDSYDTSVDNVVRTSVSDLRRRIEAYFNSEGSSETLLMEIPRGSYIPVFRSRTSSPPIAADAPNQIDTVAAEPSASAKASSIDFARTPRFSFASLIAEFVIFGLAIACFFFCNQYRTLRHSVYAWQQEPSVNAFWSKIINANPDTDIVLSDTGIGVLQALTQRKFSLDEYISRSYVGQLESSESGTGMHAAIDRILTWNLANPDEFALARQILALDPPGKKIHLYNARNYSPDLIKRDNVILFGARKSNPWDEIFDSRMNFIPEFDGRQILNRAPISGEQPSYGSDSSGYCVVAYMPKPDQSGIVLLIEGSRAEATEAAGDFLLSEEQLSNFKRMLHVSELPYFQALLKVSAVRGAPFSATIEAYRTYPNLH